MLTHAFIGLNDQNVNGGTQAAGLCIFRFLVQPIPEKRLTKMLYGID
jgi:hypothetical protein